jgi:AraC family transcriptional activator of pobA
MHPIQNIPQEDSDILFNSLTNNGLIDKISISTFNQRGLKTYYETNIHLKSTLFVLVLSGKGEIEVNFRKYPITQQDILLLSFGHFFKISSLSPDFNCISLYIGNDYIDEMYSADMLYKRVKYGVKLYKMPLMHLSTSNFDLLTQRFYFIKEIIQAEGHRYKKEMILNVLRIFFLDLSNIIEDASERAPDGKQQSREEAYFQSFLNLLALHYQKEHLVGFYANKINITPNYLTQIVRHLSGKTVSDFIYKLLYSEAKLMLKQPNLPIQEIATQLNFSDQSAFGKFFKRNSGISPKEYRNGTQK